MNDITIRFLEAYEYLKETNRVSNPSVFAKEIGVSSSTMTEICKGRTNAGIKAIQGLLNRYDEIDAVWLLKNTGSMLFKKNTLSVTESLSEYKKSDKINCPAVVTVDSQQNDNIVLVPVKAQAGYLEGYEDPEFIQTLPSYTLPNINNGVFRMFQIGGHSMFPTMHDGSYAVGQFVEDWENNIRDGRIYIVVTEDDGIIVKRCLNRIKKYGSIYCKSDNRKEYPNLQVSIDKIKEVWECKLHLSYDLPDPADIYDRMNDLEAELYTLKSVVNKK